MTLVYLGFFETLSSLLKEVFDSVLKPVLQAISKEIFDLLGGIIFDMFKEVLFDGLVLLLKLVHALKMFFDVFAGIANVMVGDEKMTFLQYLFRQSAIGTALAGMTMIGGALAFLFAVMATSKTISDSALGIESKPIEKVLVNGFRSAVTFMIVPFMCTALLQLSVGLTDSVMMSFKEANGISSNIQMDDAIFLAVAEPAAKNENVFKRDYQTTAAMYVKTKQVEKDFDIGKIDYVVGYTASILTIFLMLGATLSFIRQCVDLLVLYVVSPFFSATIALDGGEKFSKWRELFVAKFFIGFGTVFSIELFMMLMPFFTGNQLIFSDDTTMNSCIKLFFIMGGAWSIFKGNHMIMQLLSPTAAGSANEAMGMMTAMIARR